MTNALAWIRKSKGGEDDIGLEEQRRQVAELANQVADNIDTLDLGVQTGFSSLTRDADAEQLLDERSEVQNAVADIRDGKYDVLVALDDDRVCRDGYYEVMKHAMVEGGAEFVFVRDVPDDDMVHDIRRRVERATKEAEIEKSKQALEEKQRRGEPLGTAPFGLQHTGSDYERDPEEFSQVEQVLRQLQTGESYREIRDETGVSLGTISRINERGREFYRQYGDS